MDYQNSSHNKTYYNDLLFEGEGQHGEELQKGPSWFAPGGFQIKPIWQSVAESIFPERVVTSFILVIITLKFIHHATSMMYASTNLQQMVLYRSQFWFVGDAFVRVAEEDTDSKKKAKSWYLNGPVIVNQLPNACIVYALFIAVDFSKSQAYALGAGVGLWFLVNVVWNRWFMLFSKPNLAHAYQAKQYCLVNLHFFLSLVWISFFVLNVEIMGKSRYYTGPMHVVGLGMRNQTTFCGSYRSFQPNGDVMARNFSYSLDCQVPEYQATVQVAWGGKWGCPKRKAKHCQATVDFVHYKGLLEEALTSPGTRKACAGTSCKVIEDEQFLWSVHSCNKPMGQYENGSFIPFEQRGVPKEGNLAPREASPIDHWNHPPEETCSLDKYLDDPPYQVIACLAKIFNRNFDANDLTLKQPLQYILARKPDIGKDHGMVGFVGDCNTCKIKKKKHRSITGPALMAFVAYALAMLFLAGWWILSTLEDRYGWCKTPESIVDRPVKAMSFWDFFWMTSSFF